eukprot:COSAG06_NODE_2104_length_7581_cov_9.832130_8_plen_84_part_00
MEYHPAAGEDGSDDGGTLVLEKRRVGRSSQLLTSRLLLFCPSSVLSAFFWLLPLFYLPSSGFCLLFAIYSHWFAGCTMTAVAW